MSKFLKAYVPQRKMEGAGVEVDRMFGYYQVPDFDPFLMLDYFESQDANHSPGFPWHPHKGIETITYMLRGSIKHEDSLGHSGVISEGDIQWMTAGKGIYHQEMPQPIEGGYRGFQFWLNMPQKNKLVPPKYNEIKSSSIKKIKKDSAEILLICGEYEGQIGPIEKTELGVRMMHIKLEPEKEITITRQPGKKGFIFVFEGAGFVGEKKIIKQMAYTIDEGETIFKAADERLEFIFAEGKAINEPIVWYGPMVMNTNAEIQQALKDLREGTFV